LRYRLEYALFVFFSLVVRALPIEVASSLVGRLWRLLAPLSKRHRRAMAHMQIAYPDSTPDERLRLSNEMWETMGRIFAESYCLAKIAFSGRVVLDNPDEARAIFKDQTGFVVCAAHQGNWEVGVAVLAELGYKTAGIYQRLKNPFVDAAARRLREPLYPGGLLPKGDAAARAALRHVRKGGVISIMADLRAGGDIIGGPAPFSKTDRSRFLQALDTALVRLSRT
jgi:KDO2-lipid IV(A) lauroyltransferase